MELASYLEKNKIADPNWEKFLQAIFSEDLDKAFPIFISTYKSTSDENLKKVILDRISQYYYAKGFYETASRVLNDEAFRSQIFSVQESKIYFGVQLGAFSSQVNANKGKQKYSNQLKEIYVVPKEANGKKLYAVIAGKFDTRKEAEQLQKFIQKNLGKKGMVVQY